MSSAVRVIQIVLGVLGIVLGLFAYQVQVDNLPLTTPLRSWATIIAAWSFLTAGLVAWRRRPENRLGPLMVAVCFALLARQFRYSHDALVFTACFLIGELGYALYMHVALAYPSGRVKDRLERGLLKVAYTVAVGFPFAILLLYDSSHRLRYFDPARRESLLLIEGHPDLVDTLQKAFAVLAYGVLAGAFLVLILRKLVRATARARRVLAPLLLAAVVAALWAVLNGILTFTTLPPEITYDLFWWQIVGLTALPIALLAGLLRARLARVNVGELVVHLEETSPGELRDELAAALDDPTVEVAFWLPDQGEYVDANGSPFPAPIDGPDRAVTRIEHDGQPLAVLVHGPTLRDEPKLLEAVAAAARLALVNARLHAEVRAQLEMVHKSRARIVTAADEERRRIERDLHDGAQQRLVALALELRSAQRRLGESRDPELDQLLESTAEELQVALQELRELAQGIHPGILTQGGLAPALETLAARVPIPVSVSATRERLAPDIEATAYFVACEALTNVVKHSRATQAAIRALRDDAWLVVEVEDNGVGGASPQGGSGLRGLADRVEALGGHFRIESSPGSGTRILGEIPCAS